FAPATAGHNWRRGRAAPPAGRERTRHLLLRKLRVAGRRHSLRLRRYRPTFQPGDARLLERRRAADVLKMWRESRAGRTGEAVGHVEDRPRLKSCRRVGGFVRLPGMIASLYRARCTAQQVVGPGNDY